MFLINVVKAFENQKVDYAIVGGFAVALHGVVRGTIDLDLCIALNLEAFEKTEKALLGMGLEPRLPVSARDVFQFRKEYIENRNLKAWSFYDAVNPAHVVDVIISEDLKKMKVVKKTVHGTAVHIASIETLIEMKKRSAREQDLEDVKALMSLGTHP